MSEVSTAVLLVMVSIAVCVGCQGRNGNRTAKVAHVIGQEKMDYHECIRSGSLDELRKALSAVDDINLRGTNGETPLMVAIAAKDTEKMKLLLEHGADPELTDDFNATALGHAVSWDFADGVRVLLDLDVDRGYSPKYPLKQINYDLDILDTKMPESLADVMSEEEWTESLQSQQESMIEMGQNPTVEPNIADVQSVEVLELFLAAGDDVRLAPREVKRVYVGLKNGGEFQATAKDYRTHRSPRYGTANPEPMDNPFWSDMIRIGGNAYTARAHFDDEDSLESAVWCFDRFGSSLTLLADGRFIQIAGEHEDFYDPDFYIYNDVVIHDGQGGFKVFGYPEAVFPPTDFHTATLVDDVIYLVGCLGYTHQRKLGTTPVLRLALDTWKIDSVTTSGDVPSWLHDHRAHYDANRNVIRVEGGNVLAEAEGEQAEPEITPNEDRYELDLVTFSWRKLQSQPTTPN